MKKLHFEMQSDKTLLRSVKPGFLGGWVFSQFEPLRVEISVLLMLFLRQFSTRRTLPTD